MVCRRKAASSSAVMLQRSRPSTDTVPALGARMPETMLRKVVLPLPEGPTMNTISPNRASKSTELTATTRASSSPNHLLRPRATMAIAGGI